ncbi:putative DNA-binding domain-containing protein [Paraburkholderia sp.]|uniref:HvfC/BufC family peptide modification chaperone n=1 Tax=Paraburkholderia sp. TaxID=1926495 RepID=UPI0039E355FE
MKNPLDDLQQRFADAIRDPRGEPELAARLATRRHAVAHRLGIYRANAHAHWHSALANAYPVLLALTGDAYFAALARAYASAHPSPSGDLNQFGAQLPAFVEERERTTRYAWFGDMARLEWAIHTAWYAADAVPFSVREWQTTGSEKLLASRLAVHPACVAIHSRFAISDIWRAHEADAAFPHEVDALRWMLVVRPQWKPFVIEQSRAAHEAIIALQRGCTLDDAIDAALAVDAGFDVSAQLQGWIETGAITGLAR